MSGLIKNNKIMQKYILAATVLFSVLGIKAQVIIDKDLNQNISSPSVLLEFGTSNKGLLLPWVTTTGGVTAAVPGTMVYNIAEKNVKYLKGGSGGGWIDLSIETNGEVNTALQNPLTDAANATTIIGSNSTSAPGILVLESATKALVLPKVADPHLNILYPEAGMMVYDTNKKIFAVYNGTVWTFWKPIRGI